jgi:hypothetical protein
VRARPNLSCLGPIAYSCRRGRPVAQHITCCAVNGTVVTNIAACFSLYVRCYRHISDCLIYCVRDQVDDLATVLVAAQQTLPLPAAADMVVCTATDPLCLPVWCPRT